MKPILVTSIAAVATGMQFGPLSAPMLEAALHRTAALYRDREAWKRLQLNGLRSDVSWQQPAQKYAALYREMTAIR